jgi:hypothetical protein
MISAQVIADSISPQGIRLTTFQLRYPRFIHAEFMTHRMFSRNASSSRAVPVKRLIEDVSHDPAIPVYWGKNQPGMQAKEELNVAHIIAAKDTWNGALDAAVEHANDLARLGAHKQIVNRILEPFAHINVVCTATDYENFYALRRHEDAQPEIKALADAMWEAQQASTPICLNPGDWHLPYINFTKGEDTWQALQHCKRGRITRDEPSWDEIISVLLKVSVARCARVSYLTHDGRQTTVEEDIALYERLVSASPGHMSPAEHQATPDEWFDGGPDSSLDPHWFRPEQSGNFRPGWIQLRKTLPGEFIPG